MAEFDIFLWSFSLIGLTFFSGPALVFLDACSVLFSLFLLQLFVRHVIHTRRSEAKVGGGMALVGRLFDFGRLDLTKELVMFASILAV